MFFSDKEKQLYLNLKKVSYRFIDNLQATNLKTYLFIYRYIIEHSI